MNGKLLTLFAVLSLAALAAGAPYASDLGKRTNLDALKLISMITQQQIIQEQGSELADEEQGNIVSTIAVTYTKKKKNIGETSMFHASMQFCMAV